MQVGTRGEWSSGLFLEESSSNYSRQLGATESEFNMQERVTVRSDPGLRVADVVVQYSADLMTVGLGLEPTSEIPSLHFVDAIYGGVPSQTAIGKIFFDKRRQDFEEHIDFQSSEEEAEFFNHLGRDILDSVTGSSTSDGVWTWLDRPGVNRLIRLLRKGRDLAFGRDE